MSHVHLHQLGYPGNGFFDVLEREIRPVLGGDHSVVEAGRPVGRWDRSAPV